MLQWASSRQFCRCGFCLLHFPCLAPHPLDRIELNHNIHNLEQHSLITKLANTKTSIPSQYPSDCPQFAFCLVANYSSHKREHHLSRLDSTLAFSLQEPKERKERPTKKATNAETQGTSALS